MYPESIANLIEAFKLLPGIGTKTAERLSFFVLELEEEKTDFFVESIGEIKAKIRKCIKCNNYTEEEICNVCSDAQRQKDLLCVVDDIKSIYLFESLNTYKGLYYVLDELISPLNGVGPDDIGLEKLLKRIKDENFKEVILAVKADVEGETTALYIKKILEGSNLKVTKIASGVPMGADIEYIDQMTLQRALLDRKEIQ